MISMYKQEHLNKCLNTTHFLAKIAERNYSGNEACWYSLGIPVYTLYLVSSSVQYQDFEKGTINV